MKSSASSSIRGRLVSCHDTDDRLGRMQADLAVQVLSHRLIDVEEESVVQMDTNFRKTL